MRVTGARLHGGLVGAEALHLRLVRGRQRRHLLLQDQLVRNHRVHLLVTGKACKGQGQSVRCTSLALHQMLDCKLCTLDQVAVLTGLS